MSVPEHSKAGRHRRDFGSRHRPRAGALRMVDDGDGGWALAPAARPVNYVGRVGALAVALGVGGIGLGGVVVGSSAVAAADTGADASSTASETSQSQETSAGGEPAGAETPRRRGAVNAPRGRQPEASTAPQLGPTPSVPDGEPDFETDSVDSPASSRPESAPRSRTAEPDTESDTARQSTGAAQSPRAGASLVRQALS